MNYEPLIDRLMQFYTGNAYQREVGDAKDEFFDKAGTFDEGSVDFEVKMAQFVDWYLFTRPMQSTGKAAIEMVLDDPQFAFADGERPLFLNLRNSRHGLFEFERLKKDDVYIRDLFTGFKYVIRQTRLTQGFNPGEYFEARLVPNDEGFDFAPAFCFHPSMVSGYIQKEVKRVNSAPEEDQQKEREEMIARLFKMKHKHEQYRHLDVHQIYSNESKLKI